MTELTLSLDFACCCCRHPVRVTVRCTGRALDQSFGDKCPAIKVPCPDCGQVNQLSFDPSGKVRSVRPYACVRLVPEPSLN